MKSESRNLVNPIDIALRQHQPIKISCRERVIAKPSEVVVLLEQTRAAVSRPLVISQGEHNAAKAEREREISDFYHYERVNHHASVWSQATDDGIHLSARSMTG